MAFRDYCRCSQDGEATVPSTIGDEWETNPFMRCRQEAIKRYAGSDGGWRTRRALFFFCSIFHSFTSRAPHQSKPAYLTAHI